MAICRMCHKPIPDGLDFCEECEQKRTNQADESYLDSLLSLVSENDASSGVSRVASETEEPASSNTDPAPETDDMLQDILSSMSEPDSDTDTVLEDDTPSVDSEEIDDIFSDIENSLSGGLPDLINEEASEPEADIADIDTAVEEVAADTETASEDAEDNEASGEEAEDSSDVLDGLEDIINDIGDLGDDTTDISEPADMSDIEPIEGAADSEDDTDTSSADVDDLIDLLGDGSVSPFEASGLDVDTESSDELISPFEDMGLSGDSTEDLLNDITSSTDIDSIMDNIESGELEGEIKKLMPDEKSAKPDKPKKKSLFMRLFGNVVVERTPEELEEYKKKLEEDEQKKKEAIELKKQKKAQTKEEKAAEKEQKKNEKAEADKAKAEAKKKAKEEAKEKARKKKEERLALEEEEIDEGRINRVGASILFVIFAAITVLIIFGSSIYSYNLSIKNAQREFDIRHYNEAYYEVYGIDIKEDDIALYDKIMTVMYVNTQLNAYEYYMTSGCREKALDSLLKGLARYDKYLTLAIKLEITDDLLFVKNNILEQLKKEFGMTEEDAYNTMDITDTVDYSDYLYELLGTYEVDEIE